MQGGHIQLPAKPETIEVNEAAETRLSGYRVAWTPAGGPATAAVQRRRTSSPEPGYFAAFFQAVFIIGSWGGLLPKWALGMTFLAALTATLIWMIGLHLAERPDVVTITGDAHRVRVESGRRGELLTRPTSASALFCARPRHGSTCGLEQLQLVDEVGHFETLIDDLEPDEARFLAAYFNRWLGKERVPRSLWPVEPRIPRAMRHERYKTEFPPSATNASHWRRYTGRQPNDRELEKLRARGLAFLDAAAERDVALGRA